MINKYLENEAFISEYGAFAKESALFSNHVVKITLFFITGTSEARAFSKMWRSKKKPAILIKSFP